MTLLGSPQVAALIDRGPTAAVRAIPERCLNRRLRDSHCALCLECPTGAVTAAGTTIMVDAAACAGCGFCYSICPTEAFAVQGPRLAEVLRLGAESRGGTLEVVCRERPAADRVSTDANAVLRLPCLAWLSQPLAVALVTAGVVRLYLDDTRCGSCKIGRVREQILEAARGAESLLASMGRQGAVLMLAAQQAAILYPRVVPVLDPVRPAYSRRDLLGALRRGVAQAAVSAADARAPVAKKLAPLEPAQTMLLATAMARLAAQAGPQATRQVVPIASVGVGEDCTACGLCAKLCPTGALQMHQNETAFQLDVAVGRCLEDRCALCRMICPVKAVALTASSTLAEFAAASVRVLRSGGLTPCAACGVPTAAAKGETLCHACQWKKGVPGR